LLKEVDTGPASQQEVPISDDPSSKDPPPEDRSADHLPYGVDTIVIPFTWSDRQEVPVSGDPSSMDLPPEGGSAGDLPYGVDTIRLRISWPAAPASRGYNGRMWRMRRLRGWTGAARQDAPGADEGAGDRDGSAVTGPGHAPTFPEQGQVVPANQAVEGGGPASELLAAFRALRVGALQGRGPTAKEADAGLSTSDGTTVRLETGILGATPAPVTANQLRAIMPNAGAAADRYVDVLNQAMAVRGINTPEQRAAFLAQVSAETGQLQRLVEGMNYSSAQLIQKTWPRRFPTEAAAAPYVHNPEALANRVYANRNGNGDEASGDGYRFRGRGFAQTTGRGNYRAVGFEDNPEALAEPQNAANSAAAYWQSHGLNGRTAGVLNRAQLDAVSQTVNGGDVGSQERWNAYQRALRTLHGGR